MKGCKRGERGCLQEGERGEVSNCRWKRTGGIVNGAAGRAEYSRAEQSSAEQSRAVHSSAEQCSAMQCSAGIVIGRKDSRYILVILLGV